MDADDADVLLALRNLHLFEEVDALARGAQFLVDEPSLLFEDFPFGVEFKGLDNGVSGVIKPCRRR